MSPGWYVVGGSVGIAVVAMVSLLRWLRTTCVLFMFLLLLASALGLRDAGRNAVYPYDEVPTKSSYAAAFRTGRDATQVVVNEIAGRQLAVALLLTLVALDPLRKRREAKLVAAREKL